MHLLCFTSSSIISSSSPRPAVSPPPPPPPLLVLLLLRPPDLSSPRLQLICSALDPAGMCRRCLGHKLSSSSSSSRWPSPDQLTAAAPGFCSNTSSRCSCHERDPGGGRALRVRRLRVPGLVRGERSADQTAQRVSVAALLEDRPHGRCEGPKPSDCPADVLLKDCLIIFFFMYLLTCCCGCAAE